MLKKKSKVQKSFGKSWIEYGNSQMFKRTKFYFEKALQIDPEYENEQRMLKLANINTDISQKMSSFEVRKTMQIPMNEKHMFVVIKYCSKTKKIYPFHFRFPFFDTLFKFVDSTLCERKLASVYLLRREPLFHKVVVFNEKNKKIVNHDFHDLTFGKYFEFEPN